MNKKNLPFVLLTLSMFIVLIVPALLQDGMFLDGLQYSCVAKNMAVGKGSFWQPCFSDTWWKSYSGVFLEQPPFGIWLQSLFFRMFGEGMYVERFYALVTALVNALFIILIWKLLFKNKTDLLKLWWMPVLFWISIPVCYWSVQNNMLEITMSIFTLAAVYFSLRVMVLKKLKIVNLIVSGLCVFLATLTKGLPGLFPLVIIPLYWFMFKNTSWLKALLYTLCLICIPLVAYGIVMLNPVAAHSLHFYFFERLLSRISDDPTATNRFDTLFRVISELLPIMITVATIFMISKIKKQKIVSEKTQFKTAMFFIITGCSASLPLMLTMVQKGFYFVPALPFFALGFAVLLAEIVARWIVKINVQSLGYKLLTATVVLMLCASLLYSGYKSGSISRDEAVVHDVYLFGSVIPKGSIVKVDKKVYDNWSVQCYLNRYFDIAVSISDQFHYKYWIKEKNKLQPENAKLKKVALPTETLELYVIEHP